MCDARDGGSVVDRQLAKGGTSGHAPRVSRYGGSINSTIRLRGRGGLENLCYTKRRSCLLDV